MRYKKHPQPIARIVSIMKRLYAFERLRVKELAQEHEVSDKTILRDFKKIAEQIPLLSRRGVYWIDTDRLSGHQRLPEALLQGFASNAGLRIACLEPASASIPVISFAIAYDGIDRSIADALIESIEHRCKCTFGYTNNRGEFSRRTVSPIQLRTEKGKWYLLARDDVSGGVRTFDFLKIRDFGLLSAQPGEATPEQVADALSRSSVWASSETEPYEVQLEVSAYARRYLDEVPLHRSQTLLSPHADGSATYLYTITHPMEILPEVKSWMPHLHILTPDRFRHLLREEIEDFLAEMDHMDI